MYRVVNYWFNEHHVSKLHHMPYCQNIILSMFKGLFHLIPYTVVAQYTFRVL